ncbi:hypothetical protein CDN99_23805 [Roseateles aquatilis]|uniref:Uncharacterized protein n=1 Tax=Roseateles aquatilis TaxID=431061 RepID=A0A246IY74_9BURK|nr:hypothetical protein [Roseateles aquatilis]OWQ84759.1 hypothetical protein CDN99_23805 [Roseateles aquatilis]
MFHPYENIIIGNFLYSLGLAMGRQAGPAPACVNLLQQTPADPVLGDVMLQFPGVWRLIEFKRTGGDEKKEHRKRRKFLAATSPARGRQRLRAISRQVHWYLVNGPDQQGQSPSPQHYPMTVRPYLHQTGDQAIPMEAFAQDLVQQACKGRFTDEDELADYMAIVETLAGVRRYNAGGLLVGVNAGGDGGTGGITYLPVPNFADLRGTARMLELRYLEEVRQRETARLLEAERQSRVLQKQTTLQRRSAPERAGPGNRDNGREH